MKNIILMLKGMIIGVANIIPGVSGGTLMITLGIYEEVIDTISHFFKNLKSNLKFILPIGIGMIIAILLLSKVISFCLDKYPFPTTFFFVGLIIGGVPLLWRRASEAKTNACNWLVFVITFLIILLFTFLKGDTNAISLNELNIINIVALFIVGVISAATMVIPGISGSFVLMLIGFYEPIVNTLKNLTNFNLLLHNLLILIPFGLGIIVGIIGVAKLIEYLLKRYPVKTYYGVLGFVLASIVAIIQPVLNVHPSIIELTIALLLVLTGGIVAYKIGDK